MRQDWLAARGDERELIIGVTGSSADFRAHAWLDGDPESGRLGFAELARKPPPGRRSYGLRVTIWRIGTADSKPEQPVQHPPATTVTETTGGVTHTWTNYTNAGGTQGPSIPSAAAVQIACKRPGFTVADGNTWWYRIASSPWNGSYYASADAFYKQRSNSGQPARNAPRRSISGRRRDERSHPPPKASS